MPTTGPNLRHPGEKPPVMPVAATKHTAAGAKAFAKFFILTIDWGFATTSGAYMRHYYAKSCVECRSFYGNFVRAHADGAHFVGGRVKITKVSTPTAVSAVTVVRVTLDISGSETIDAKGRFKNGEPPSHDQVFSVRAAWRNSMWIVTDLGLE